MSAPHAHIPLIHIWSRTLEHALGERAHRVQSAQFRRLTGRTSSASMRARDKRRRVAHVPHTHTCLNQHTHTQTNSNTAHTLSGSRVRARASSFNEFGRRVGRIELRSQRHTLQAVRSRRPVTARPGLFHTRTNTHTHTHRRKNSSHAQ